MASQIKVKRSSVEGKVPLTTDLELGELAINTYDGKLFLKRNDGTRDYIREVGGNQGFEVKNQTGSTISKGTAVGFAGTLGSNGKLLIQPFLANGATDSQYFMGIVENDIVSGGDGYVISHGKILNLNTSQWAQGDILYVSSSISGGLTNTQPPAPNNKIIVAAVINSSATSGVLEVRVTLGSSLGNDELVELGTLTNGDTLVYNSVSGRFENAQPVSGGITADQTVTLTNKTISGGIYSNVVDITGSVRSTPVVVSALDVDCSLGNYFIKQITANSTFTFSNAPSSKIYSFVLEIIHTSGTITWPAVYWPGSIAPTLTVDKNHLFVFITDDGGLTWRGAYNVDYAG